MRIYLKDEWDVPIHFSQINNEIIGDFTGRKRELLNLTSEVKRSKTGSILVCGYRGVGKTSLVYKSLSRVKDKDTIIVLLNASQLEVESEASVIDPKKIIENLIKRLYAKTRFNENLSDSVKNQIYNLYVKAGAAEYKNIISDLKGNEFLSEIILEKEHKISLNKKTIIGITFILAWFFGIFLSFFSLTLNEWFNNLFPLLLMTIPFLITYYVKKTESSKKIERSSANAQIKYFFDDSVSNLEFDLEKIHNELARGKKRLIYVIDELDKLKDDQVVRVIKYFKNLFTLSNAIFVFIGDEKLYDLGKGHKSGSYRDEEYTYFTSRYFLSRPNWDDLNVYLDVIINREKIEELDENELEILKRSMCFDARNDYFDLKFSIRDRINFDEEEKPYIELHNNSDDLKKSRFHKAITILFEGKYISSKYSEWKKNEIRIRSLFDYTFSIISGNLGKEFNDRTGALIEDEILRAYNGLLHRHGVFMTFGSENFVNINGLETPIRGYKYTGTFTQDIPDTFEEKTEYEQRYIQEYEKITDYYFALVKIKYNIYNKTVVTRQDFYNSPQKYTSDLANLGISTGNLFKQYFSIYNELSTKIPPFKHKREDVQAASKDLKNFKNILKDNLNRFVYNCINAKFAELKLQISNLSQAANLINFNNIPNEIKSLLQISDPKPFQIIRDELIKGNPFVIYDTNFSHQLVILNKNLNQISNLLKNYDFIQKIVRFIIIADSKDIIPNIIISNREIYIITLEDPTKLEDSLVQVIDEILVFLEFHSFYGDIYYRKKELNNALIQYDKMLKQNPNNLRTLWNKGKVLFDLNNYEDSIKMFDQIILENPKFIEVLEKKAEALVNLNKPQEAIDCYKYFIEEKPDAEKLKIFDQILKIDEINTWALIQKSSTQLKLNQNDEALKNINIVLENNPNNLDALRNKVKILLKLNRKDETIKIIKEAIKNNPSQIELYDIIIELEPSNLQYRIEKANNLLKNKDYKAALECFEKVMQEYPNNVMALNGKARTLIKLDQLTNALNIYKKIIEIEPENLDALLNIGLLLNQLEKAEEALTYFDEVLEKNPDNLKALKGKANAYYLKNELGEAIKYYKKILTFDSNNNQIQKKIYGLLKQLVKNPKDLKLFVKSLDFKQKDVDVIEYLADIFYKEKQYKKALNYYNKILKIIPDHDKALKQLNRIDKKLQDLAEMKKNEETAKYKKIKSEEELKIEGRRVQKESLEDGD